MDTKQKVLSAFLGGLLIALLFGAFASEAKAATLLYEYGSVNPGNSISQFGAAISYPSAGAVWVGTTTFSGVDRIQFSVNPAFDPQSNVELVIYEDSGGAFGGVVATSGAVDVKAVTGVTSGVGAGCTPSSSPVPDPCFINFDFSVPFDLTASQTYYFALEETTAGNPGWWEIQHGVQGGFAENTTFRWNGTAFTFDSGRHPYMRIYADATGPPPPISEYNEVIDYIYEPDLNNNFGTSTIGAHFSIAEPDWIDGIGVELRGPLGNVVWSATSTADSAGIYGLFDEYNFDSTGSYELMAYFVQDGNRINNTVSVFIVINAEEWVFDPVTGDLVPISSSTIATSSLDRLNITCPDDLLVGSLCKLAVGLFIPKLSSIQAIQGSFSALMNKAPFSFFTQSKTVLDAFRTGTASSGGSFSLTLYGSEVPIVSSENAAGIGLTQDIIDFFKSIMVVGLWLMLAWYLYWRIASIFGV